MYGSFWGIFAWSKPLFETSCHFFNDPGRMLLFTRFPADSNLRRGGAGGRNCLRRYKSATSSCKKRTFCAASESRGQLCIARCGSVDRDARCSYEKIIGPKCLFCYVLSDGLSFGKIRKERFIAFGNTQRSFVFFLFRSILIALKQIELVGKWVKPWPFLPWVFERAAVA